ncbi:MAG TPA: branched-chain amino acid ABC transporter permease [Candidatus Methylomirabilis sp.]
MLLLQVGINGILLGGIYACVALGFSLVWGVMNIINVAHGAFLMLGAYVTYWAFTAWRLDPILSIPLSVAALFAFGYAVQWGIINRIVRAPLFMTLVLTFGLDMLIVNLALLAWEANYRTVAPWYAPLSLAAGGVIIPVSRLAIFVVSLVITAALYLFLSRTRMGRAIQATRMDLDGAQLVGVSIGRIYAWTFGISAAMAGAAGSLLAVVTPVSPIMGASFLGKAFLVCVLGGLGNMAGALLGGVILGLFETGAAVAFGPGYQDAASLVLLLLVLVIRPAGLLGRAYY